MQNDNDNMKAAMAAAALSSVTNMEETLALEDGWKVIDKVGVEPFIHRIEMGIDSDERYTIKAEVFMQVYDIVFKMCIQREPDNFSEPIYNRYADSIHRYLLETAFPSLLNERDHHELAFLKEWVERWRRQQRLVKGLGKMFMYLDRFYVTNNEEILPLNQKGYLLYKEVIFDELKSHALQCVLNAVIRERHGDVQDREVLAVVVESFVDLGFKLDREIAIYREDFEERLVENSRIFYRVAARNWMDQDSASEFLKKAELALNEEQGRLGTYLHHTSTEPLMKACREEILLVHEDELLGKNSGINSMLLKNEVEDLSRLYDLYAEVENGKTPIAEALKEHVKTLGNELVESAKNAGKSKMEEKKEEVDEHALIKNIIELHDRYLVIVQECFRRDQIFEKALKEAFEDFINKDFFTSNLLAKYINSVLTRGSRVQVDDLERTLNHVVMLYGYIRHKDVFEEKYHNFLANRLLTGRSASQVAEKTMIAKLKNEAGYQWTTKLETMFKDVEKSSELQEDFNNSFGTEFDTDMRVIVCTTGCWPSAAAEEVEMPRQLVPITQRFRDFYLSKFSGTKLTWAMHQGEAEVQVRFSKDSTHILVCHTYMMMILLCFNEKKILTFEQIAHMTQIPRKDLEQHLLSLAHPKRSKILKKKPMTKNVNDTDKFAINGGYSNRNYRVHVRFIGGIVNTGSDTDVSQQILTQRRHQIDAACVRVMKTRQRLEHNQLVSEVMKQLTRFQPDPSHIKKRIEVLIEQEYLERDEDDRRIYNYLA